MYSLVPDLRDVNVIKGVIYMTSHHNIYRVSNIVREYLSEREDDAVYRYFLQVVCENIRKNPLTFISSLFAAGFKENEKFVQRIVNESDVIDSIVKAKCNSRSVSSTEILTVARSVANFVEENNASKILHTTKSTPVFNSFGYHPAISGSVKLQVRWIMNIVEEPHYAVYSLPWYVTDKALELVASKSIHKAIDFIEMFLEKNLNEEKPLLTPEGMRRVVAVYAVAENSAHGERLLAKIREYEQKYCNLD